MELSWTFSVLSLFIWQLFILHRNHLKLSTQHWIIGFWWKKLKLGHALCTKEKFLLFTSVSNILLHSLMFLNFWKLANFFEISWNFIKSTEPVILNEKILVWIFQNTSNCFSRVCKISPMELSEAFSVVSYLFIWQLIILHRNHLKLSTLNHWVLIKN